MCQQIGFLTHFIKEDFPMIPVNPEAIGLFGLFATVICFGLEQLGVGVKGADHEKLTRTLGYICHLLRRLHPALHLSVHVPVLRGR